MAEVKEKQLNTRILLRYDTYANWIDSDPILKAGEVALATVASNFKNAAENVDGKQKVAANVQSAPTVLIKVGDGTHHYSELQFTSAKAADVYDWAKAEVKPTYTASEIKNGDKTITEEIAKFNADILALQQAVGEDGSVAEQIADAIEEAVKALDSNDAAAENEFVTKVVLTDGVVSVESAPIRINQIKGKADTDDDLETVITALNAAIVAAKAQADKGVQDAEAARVIAARAEGKIDTFMETIEVGGKDVVDTLKEVLDLIQTGDDVATGLLADVEQAKTDILTNAGAITALQGADTTINGRIDEVAGDLAEEVTFRGQEITRIETLITSTVTPIEEALEEEVERAKAKEAEIVADVAKKVETVKADTGITATRSGAEVTIGIDEETTFVFNCGGAATYAN